MHQNCVTSTARNSVHSIQSRPNSTLRKWYVVSWGNHKQKHYTEICTASLEGNKKQWYKKVMIIIILNFIGRIQADIYLLIKHVIVVHKAIYWDLH